MIFRLSHSVLLCGLFLLFTGKAGWAADRSIIQAENSFAIGTGLTHLGYGETMGGSGYLDTENGNLNTTLIQWDGLTDDNDRGLVFMGAHVPPRTYLSWNLIYINGATAYDGATLGGTPVSGTDLSEFVKTNLAMGVSYSLSNHLILIPNVILGYNYWKRTIQPNFIFQGLNFENTESYSHYNVGIGVLMDYRLMEGEVITLGADLLQNFNSNMSSSLTGDNFILGNSLTYRLKGKITYEVGKSVNFFGRVDFESFSYGSSSVQQDGFLEPDSTSSLTLYTVGVAYAY